MFAYRLNPNDDLKQKLFEFTKIHEINSGILLSCVGSLKKAALRLADANKILKMDKKFEIVSCMGTLCTQGLHLHISISDNTGKTFGGHLLDGNIINTTAEIIIGTAENFIFKRKYDSTTGFKELKIL
jgi:predicted DNA-binding protein with PD1-like motif